MVNFARKFWCDDDESSSSGKIKSIGTGGRPATGQTQGSVIRPQ